MDQSGKDDRMTPGSDGSGPVVETPAPSSHAGYVVRYGVMRWLNEFTDRQNRNLPRGTTVICRTERGLEWGTILSAATPRTREYLGLMTEPGRIVRVVTPDDERDRDALAAREREAFLAAREAVAEARLQMQLVDVELLFGGDRLVFYYVAEQRVDFRELVKRLAGQFKTRVELRQLGIRDEAKLLADYGDCGKPVCCNTHLREMPPVSMKMAKLQKATLDPNKISGRCGRLKCCLRYEYDTYEEHRKELPPVGATVVTKQGTGKVVGQELLARKLIVAYEGQRQMLTDARDVVTVISKKRGDAAP
jgi:cell fate regulator YaaT (PSP1 superfamily)